MSVDTKLSYESYDHRRTGFWGPPCRISQYCEQLVWSEDTCVTLTCRPVHIPKVKQQRHAARHFKSHLKKKKRKNMRKLKHLCCLLAQHNQCMPRCCNSADLSLPASMISHVKLRAAAPLRLLYFLVQWLRTVFITDLSKSYSLLFTFSWKTQLLSIMKKIAVVKRCLRLVSGKIGAIQDVLEDFNVPVQTNGRNDLLSVNMNWKI